VPLQLQRWYELDPSGARPAIDPYEIHRPRFGARVLGCCRIKRLPKLTLRWLSTFVASDDADGEIKNLASLSRTYATDAIPSTDYRKSWTPGSAHWACAIQKPDSSHTFCA